MNLSDSQKQQITAWLEQGLKVADVQKKMSAEFGVSMTYMETRFLLDDLRLKPKDPEPPKEPVAASPIAPPSAGALAPVAAGAPASADATPLSAVKISVDALARPGTVVSGKVTFGDGQTADWYLDQMGRPGLVPAQKGYRPSQPDIMEFQELLQVELQKLGF